MKEINQNAPVKCNKSVLINATSVEVWKVLTEIDRWPLWQKEIKSAKLEGPLKAASKFLWKSGGMNIHSEIHTADPYTFFGWTGKALGLSAIHNWRIVDLQSQTEVHMEESMDGMLASLFKKRLNKQLDKNSVKWLVHLQKECEQLTK